MEANRLRETILPCFYGSGAFQPNPHCYVRHDSPRRGGMGGSNDKLAPPCTSPHGRARPPVRLS